jgi:hypothetical protein
MPQKIHLLNTKNRPAVGRISILAELGLRPIQAEPVQAELQNIEQGMSNVEITAEVGVPSKFCGSIVRYWIFVCSYARVGRTRSDIRTWMAAATMQMSGNARPTA